MYLVTFPIMQGGDAMSRCYFLKSECSVDFIGMQETLEMTFDERIVDFYKLEEYLKQYGYPPNELMCQKSFYIPEAVSPFPTWI